MRLLALVGLVGLLSACGAGLEEGATAPVGSEERTQLSPPESWCNSYTSQKYCPSVCVWYSEPAPGYCGVPAESVVAEPEPVQMGPSEAWCNSYTSQKYCPSVCAWYSEPAPGYCGLKATSARPEPVEAQNDCPGPVQCTTNADCDSICGGPGAGVCKTWTCQCYM